MFFNIFYDINTKIYVTGTSSSTIVDTHDNATCADKNDNLNDDLNDDSHTDDDASHVSVEDYVDEDLDVNERDHTIGISKGIYKLINFNDVILFV